MEMRVKGEWAVEDDACIFNLYSWVDRSDSHWEKTLRKHQFYKERAWV